MCLFKIYSTVISELLWITLKCTEIFTEFHVLEDLARKGIGINIIDCYFRHNCKQLNKHCTLNCVPCDTCLYIYKATQVNVKYEMRNISDHN